MSASDLFSSIKSNSRRMASSLFSSLNVSTRNVGTSVSNDTTASISYARENGVSPVAFCAAVR